MPHFVQTKKRRQYWSLPLQYSGRSQSRVSARHLEPSFRSLQLSQHAPSAHSDLGKNLHVVGLQHGHSSTSPQSQSSPSSRRPFPQNGFSNKSVLGGAWRIHSNVGTVFDNTSFEHDDHFSGGMFPITAVIIQLLSGH